MLRDSSARLQKLGLTVNAAASQGVETKLLARRDNIEIKVEVNAVLRGVVGKVTHRTLVRHAPDVLQAEVVVPVASPEDVAELAPVAQGDARLLLDRDGGLASERGQAARLCPYLFERDAAVGLLRSG